MNPKDLKGVTSLPQYLNCVKYFSITFHQLIYQCIKKIYLLPNKFPSICPQYSYKLNQNNSLIPIYFQFYSIYFNIAGKIKTQK